MGGDDNFLGKGISTSFGESGDRGFAVQECHYRRLMLKWLLESLRFTVGARRFVEDSDRAPDYEVSLSWLTGGCPWDRESRVYLVRKGRALEGA